ncbi:10969_t:CDS:2, partial [Funneliformis geosporum]
MLNETSEENLLEFSKKMLDAAFGLSENNIKETPSTAEDPTSVQTSTFSPLPIALESKIKPRSEKKKVKINMPSFQSQPVNDHKKQASSDSATSFKVKNSNIFDTISDTLTNFNLKEDTTETPLRSPGLMEMRLKRKSIMVSEEEDPNCSVNSDELHIETDNPSHLFWVPAHLHPEIAPNEFRKWLKYYAKDEFNSGLTSLRRRKSTLSKQYIPSEVEDDEETTDNKEESEKKSSGFDWESFGESDGIISHSSESTKLNILRRSLSLNLPPFIGGTISNPNDPNIFDRHSSPDVDSKILVPRMAPALKRTARTKIRRNSVAGEQNPRRFSAHRRTRSTHVSSDKRKRSEDKIMSNIPKKRSESALSIPFIPPQVDTEKIDMNFTDNYNIISNEMVDEPEEISNNIELDCIDVKDGMGPIRIVLEDNDPEANVTPSQRTSSLSSDADHSFSKLGVEPSHDKSNLLQVDTSIQPGTASTTPPTSPASPTTAQASTKRTSAWSWLWSGGSEEKLKEGEKDKEEKKEKESKPKKKEKEGEKDKEEKKEKESKPKKKEKEKEGEKDKEEKKEKELKLKKKEKEKEGEKDKEEKKEKESKPKKKEKEKEGEKDKEEKKEKESKPKKKEKEKEGEKDKEEKKEKELKPKKNKLDKPDKVEKTEKSEKSDKNDKNEKENNDLAVKEKDKEKSPKISLSSIFSWPSQNKGKSSEDSSTTTISTTPLPQPTTPNKKTKYTNYNRLPIHVERAIYRLSHIKLANPRRPLHEQVLISNMMFWYLSLINKQQVENGEGGNPNAEMAVQIVKSKVGKEKAGRKRRKGEKKSGLTRKGAGSSAEIAYKAPQYDMNLIPLSNEFEEVSAEDYSDNDYQSEEEIKTHSYQYYNDEYLSDGTDGGYLDETNGRIESSHGGDLLNSSAEFDDKIGESSSGDKNIKNYVRSSNGRSKSPTGKRPSPNGRSTSPTSKNRNPVSSDVQRKSVPPSNTRKSVNVLRNRAS